MFSFFVTYAEMCSECKIDGSILPWIESFQMRLKLPKVNFVFYEYFSKAVVGDGI
jgi:PhoPQ-activated pathogenicity-related protein